MSRCLVSFGVGEGAAWREFTLPPMQAYAKRHGYETCFDAAPELSPPSWGKVPLLLRLLESHDAVLWLDADVMVMDWSEDIADAVGETAAVGGLVAHQVEARHCHGMQDVAGLCRVPNCGVMYLRREAAPLLSAMLGLYGKYRDHPWWEQAALIELLDRPEEWRLTNLSPGWNRHPFDCQPCDRVRFYHATAIPNRLDFLRTMMRYFQ
jgi:hypothetical protein